MSVRIGITAALIMLFASATARAQGHPETTIDAVNVVWQSYGYDVYPTADATTNDANIEWAVANVVPDNDGEPGRVLLKSHAAGDASGFLAFDFGPTRDHITIGDFNLLVCHSVVLEGEVREDTYTTENTSADDPLLGEHRMTELLDANIGVNWWLSPLLCDPEWCPECCDVAWCDTAFAETVRFRNLVIRRPLFVAFWIGSALEFPADAPPVAHYLDETTIENLRIVDTLPDPFDGSAMPVIVHVDYGDLTIRDTYADIAETEIEPSIHIGFASTAHLTEPWEEEPDLIPVGPVHVEIVDNTLVIPSAPQGSIGIGLWDPVDAIVTDNTIEAGIGVAARIHRHGTIADNEITASRVGFMGMSHDPLPDEVEVPDSDLPPGVTVRDNQVNLDPSGNLDTINPSAGVMGLYSAYPEGLDCWIGSTSGTTFEDNVFSGTAEYGVYFGDLELDGCAEEIGDDTIADASTGNWFHGNDFSGLTTSVAQVFLGEGAEDNTFGVDGEHDGNTFGALGSEGDALVEVWGADNSFVEDSYPEAEGLPEDVALWWFRSTSSGNLVQDPVLPECLDPADYFVDEGTDNQLVGDKVCDRCGCSPVPGSGGSTGVIGLLLALQLARRRGRRT